MMKRPNGYLLDTGYMWELYAPDGTFLEKSFPAVSYTHLADPESWDICIEMNWNASWYGDCVSLVVSSCYGGTDAPFHNGWCLSLIHI